MQNDSCQSGMFLCVHPQNRKCEQICQVDGDDFLYRVVTPSVQHGSVASSTSASQGEGNLQDFILLASKRKPCNSGSVEIFRNNAFTLGKTVTQLTFDWPAAGFPSALLSVLCRDSYVIALRSVSLPTHPPVEGYKRGEVLCAGFTILETKSNMSLVRLKSRSRLGKLLHRWGPQWLVTCARGG